MIEDEKRLMERWKEMNLKMRSMNFILLIFKNEIEWEMRRDEYGLWEELNLNVKMRKDEYVYENKWIGRWRYECEDGRDKDESV